MTTNQPSGGSPENANTQLPVEWRDKIDKEAEDAARLQFHPYYSQDANTACRICYRTGATAYATKLVELQKLAIESDKQRKEANDQLREAKKLLNEVFQKHETGLLPDRFIYEKIKKFLYGD